MDIHAYALITEIGSSNLFCRIKTLRKGRQIVMSNKSSKHLHLKKKPFYHRNNKTKTQSYQK